MVRNCIAVIAFLMFFVVQAKAQLPAGNVVVHSDPRLAVLLKRNPTAAPPITPVANSEERRSHVATKNTPAKENVSVREKIVPRPVHDQVSNPLPSAPTHQPPPPAAHEIAETAQPKKPAPPVHPFVLPPAHKEGRIIYSGKGYRVQIYNGADRDKAMKVKKEFMRLYPAMRTYLTYISPCFRVKVGDYRNRSDAAGMLKEANAMYQSPCMIVPDDIAIHAN